MPLFNVNLNRPVAQPTQPARPAIVVEVRSNSNRGDEEVLIRQAGAEPRPPSGSAHPQPPSSPNPSIPKVCLCGYKMLLCCCWPVHKCVSVLSVLDTLVVAFFAFKSFDVLHTTFSHPHWTTVVTFLFFMAFLTCQVIATVFIHMAHKKNLAHYCLPRLVLIAGLLVCSLVAAIVLFLYLGGASVAINDFLFRLRDNWLGQRLTDVERVELRYELRSYAYAMLALSVVFCVYCLFELLLTRKFQKQLNDFRRVPTKMSAPPAYNPQYGSP